MNGSIEVKRKIAPFLHMNQYGKTRLPFRILDSDGIGMSVENLPENHTGPRIFDVIDASGGYASACLGANHPFIKDILPAALKGGYSTDEVENAYRDDFLTSFFGEKGFWTENFPFSEYHVAGRNSGSEGMELALRLLAENRFNYRAQRIKEEYKGRDMVLAFEGAWHGWTTGVTSLLNRRHYRSGLFPTAESSVFGLTVKHLPFGEFEPLKEFFDQYGSRLLGVVVEPLQGDAGILCPPAGYLRKLAELASQAGALLVSDEVLTFAKTGSFFATRDEQGAIPTDITVIGKSLGMGVVSTSLVIARRNLSVRPTGVVCTSDLRPFVCHIMNEGCRFLIREELHSTAAFKGSKLREGLNERLIKDFPQVFREVRGKGLLNGVELTAEAAPYAFELRNELIRSGVYVEIMSGAGRRSHGLRYVFPTLRFAPPLIVTDEQIEEIVERAYKGTRSFTQKPYDDNGLRS